VSDGNSLSVTDKGIGTVTPMGAMALAFLGTPRGVTFTLAAKGGNTTGPVVGGDTANMIARYPRHVAPAFQAGAPVNVVVAWEGVNDLIRGASVDTAIAHLATYTTLAHRTGFKVIVATMLPVQDTEPSIPLDLETKRAQYNRRLRETWPAIADGLADIAAEPRLGGVDSPRDSTLYFRDRLHLRAAGHLVAARVVAGALAALYCPSKPLP